MAVNKNARESSRQSSSSPARASGFEQAKSRGQQSVDTSGISTRDRGDRGSDDFDYSAAARTAEGTDNSDGHKYQVAVERARQIAGDDVSESQMRDLVDAEFAKLNPTATGEQMRGEDNFGARAIGGINDAIDNVTDLAGNGIDLLWDGIVGNAAGLLGGAAGLLTGNDDWGRNANEFVSGLVGDDGNDGPTVLDTDVLGDVALDLAISAIPGVGVPIMLGKSALQNSNNIREAIDGRDSISGERLDEGQIATKGLAALADVALSALPGLGRARNLTKASQLASGTADDVARFVEKPVNATLKETFSPSNIARQTAENADEIVRRLPNAASAIRGGGSEAAKTLGDKGVRGAREAISNVLGGGRDAVRALRRPGARGTLADEVSGMLTAGGIDDFAEFVGQGGSKAMRAAKASKSAADVAADGAKGVAAGAGDAAKKPLAGRIWDFVTSESSTAPAWLAGIANMPLQAAAYGDTDYATALMAIADDARSDGLTGVSPYMTALLPLGAAKVTNARSMPGPSGRVSRLAPALRYAQVGAMGDAGRRGMASSRDAQAMSDEDIDEYLSRIGGGSLASSE